MHCNNCWNENTRVLDSRSSENGSVIRRRRLCENCGNRFTTYEKIEVFSIIVEKSMNRKEKYEKEKLQDSIIKATNKRNISILEINEIITRLENNWSKKSEITSKEIWKDVLDELKQLDEVSYIRYASVHLNFETSRDFINFIQHIFLLFQYIFMNTISCKTSFCCWHNCLLKLVAVCSHITSCIKSFYRCFLSFVNN